MRSKLTFPLFVGILGLASTYLMGCKKENQVKACFDVYQNNTPKEIVSFESCSENASSYLWEFGDGTTSTSSNPDHIYQELGAKTIKLTVYGEGKEDSYSKTISVNAIAPKSLTITKIRISAWKDTYNNGPWDPDGYADLFPKITNDDRYLYISNHHHDNCEVGSTYEYNTSSGLPIVIEDMDDEIYIEWYDKDSGLISQFVGSLGFKPSEKHVFGEDILVFDQNEFQFELEVIWEY